MSLNRQNLVHNVNYLSTGDGFRRVAEVDINALKVTADGTVLTASSVPAKAALETSFMGVSLVASQTALGTLTLTLPRDYDESQDNLRIRILASSAGTTNQPTIDAAIYRKRAGAALSADLDPTISAAAPKSTSYASWLEIDADGLGCQAGDALCIVLTSSAHTTDALSVYGIEVWYRSNLAFSDITLR